MSWTCGIIYVSLFGISLSQQVFVNYHSKSTLKYSTDCALLGSIGFFFFLLNQTIGRIDETSGAGRVHVVDILFALEAFLCVSCCYAQTFIYPSEPCLKTTKIIAAIVPTVFFLLAFIECWIGVPLEHYTFLSLIQLTAIIAAGSFFYRYQYQIRENFVNKSTSGLSKSAVWTDFLGGIFCFLQLHFDSVIAGFEFFIQDPQMNLATVLNAFFVVVHNSIILVQIYCFYADRQKSHTSHDFQRADCFCEEFNHSQNFDSPKHIRNHSDESLFGLETDRYTEGSFTETGSYQTTGISSTNFSIRE